MRSARTARQRMKTSRLSERHNRRRSSREQEGGGVGTNRLKLWVCVLLLCAGLGILAQVGSSHKSQSEAKISLSKPTKGGGGSGRPKPWKAGSASGVGGGSIRDNGGDQGIGRPGSARSPEDTSIKEGDGAAGSRGAHRDPANAVEMSYAVGPEGLGPIETFLSRGNKLPVMLLTCDRAELLENTIKSLRQVRGMDMTRVMVLQDGSDPKVAAVVESEGLYLKQHNSTPALRGGPKAGEGAARIALHYKFSLDHVFEKEPEAPAVIIVEDDLLLSPDFLEYFEANAPVLERDPETLVLSAWNDNGYRGRVSDKSELQRTLYFPGLGWLMSRELYGELGPRWPREHWDHWLRNSNQHKGRECVFPEVPRTYHNGVKGTFMNQEMHDKLFKNIDYNTDEAFRWISPATDRLEEVPPPSYAKAILVNYERRVEARIQAARHINDLNDLPRDSADGQGRPTVGDEEVVFWYSLPKTEESQVLRGPKGPPFRPLSEFFGIWHEYWRTEHKGMHSFRYGGGSHVMLVNVAKSPYASLKPAGLIPATMDHLRGFGSRGQGVDEEGQRRKLQAVPGDEPGVSCKDICSNKGMECIESGFNMLNSCAVLKETAAFPCDECSESYGPDQPCYVEMDAPVANFPGQCLVSSNPSDSRCSAKHELTRRLCPCEPSNNR